MLLDGRKVRFVILGAVLVLSLLAAAPATGAPATPRALRPGDVVVDHGATAVVPPPGLGVVAHVDLADGSSQTLSISTAPDGTVRVGSLGREQPSAPHALASSPPACQDDAYNLAEIGGKHYKWYGTYNWYFNAGSTPSEITVDNAESALRQGTTNITHANNNCGLTDNISATAAYQGRTSQGVDINTDGTCQSYQANQSVSGFGDLPSGILGVTCTWADTSSTPAKAVQSDVRFNKADYQWVVNIGSGCSNKWSVEAVATHERGHTYGLGHVSEADHGNLTMSTAINGPCQNSESTLGLGDVKGLRQLY
jgi:Matrixin